MNTKRLTAISYGHFSIDILNSSVAMILTAAAGQFDLAVSQIGLGAMIYTFAASLTQPLFGLLADRVRGRWLGALGLLWTMVFYAMLPLAPTYPVMLAILTVAAFGSAAFHPVGIVNAADAGGRYPTTATSVFFLLGQSGLALGPIISGIILQRYGINGLPFIALAMTPAMVMMALYLRTPMADHGDHAAPTAAGPRRTRSAGAMLIGAFIMVIALRATTIQSFVTLLPKYFDDMGLTSGTYGFMVGIFTLCGALGTFAGGYLGDRMDRRFLMAVSLVLSTPFALLMLSLQGWAYFVAAGLAGAFLNVPHSILLVIGQDLLPKRKGLMGGVVLGFMFASGAATAWLASWAADYVGLGTVLGVLAFMPIGAAALALLLPGAVRREAPQPQSSPAAAD